MSLLGVACKPLVLVPLLTSLDFFWPFKYSRPMHFHFLSLEHGSLSSNLHRALLWVDFPCSPPLQPSYLPSHALSHHCHWCSLPQSICYPYLLPASSYSLWERRSAFLLTCDSGTQPRVPLSKQFLRDCRVSISSSHLASWRTPTMTA
jgi:hypothetical protein